MKPERANTETQRWPWWAWLIFLLFPIPFSPWWLGLFCLMVFILLLIVLREPGSK
jgi:hypothetical protein